MKRTMIRSMQAAFAIMAVFAGLFGSVKVSSFEPRSLVYGSFVTQAHAIIGRPLTPMSYAGVARRSAVGVGVGVAVGVGAAAVAVAPACVQVVDIYGRIATVCR